MAYKLSKRSLDRLSGVDGRLQAVVNSAIHRSKIDFGVICGIRTLDELLSATNLRLSARRKFRLQYFEQWSRKSSKGD